jgi:glycosyltransferase involved in cell wall biosynthesis
MSTDNLNLLEIAVITYNRHAKLARTLESLSQSVMGKCPITIYDNASTDRTPEVIHDFVAKLPGLNYVRRTRNITIGPNLILAYAEAKARYFWLLCDDDLIDPKECDKIHSQLASLEYDAILLNALDLEGLSEGSFSSRELQQQKARLYYLGSFLPGIIYPTRIIDQAVLKSMMIHSMDLFPQIHLVHALTNADRKYYVHLGTALRREPNEDIGLSWVSYTYYWTKSITTLPRRERTLVFMDRFCATDKPATMIIKSVAYVQAFRGERRIDVFRTCLSMPLRFVMLMFPILLSFLCPRSILRKMAMTTKIGVLQPLDSNRM